jgi:exodeoxyribonuclease V alpha subunit
MQHEGRIRSAGASVPGSIEEAPAGTIERVTFHNVENGFCVLRVKTRGRRDLITVVGHAASISAASG